MAPQIIKDEEEDLQLEMESLMHETLGNDEINNPSPLPQPKSNANKWAALACFLGVILVLVLQQSGQPDANSLETNVEALPAAVEEDGDHDNKRAPPSSAANKGASKSPALPKKKPKIDMPRPDEPAGFKHPASYFSDVYVRRARSDRKTTFVDEWGSWTFTDPNPDHRLPAEDWEALVEKYPNRDIPRADIPPNAWQADPSYLEPWLDQAIALSERGIKAILAEYGHYDIKSGVPLEMAMADADETRNAYMFNLTVLEHGAGYPKKALVGNGGLVSPTFLKRLKRVLLHAIMTQDKFFFTLGGHSSSAAHGNHFQQSYTLQVQRALEPLLARLGVYHIARNIGMGGLGTGQNGLGSQSMYGGDNALLLWDSGM